MCENLTRALSQMTVPLKQTEVIDIRKIVQSYTNGDKCKKMNTDENLLMKNEIQDITCDKENWVVGHCTDGTSCILIVWFGRNIILNLDTNIYETLKTPFIDVDEYDKTIIKGVIVENVTRINSDTNDIFFVAEQVYVKCGTCLLELSFNERYSKLFDIKYNAKASVIFVIITLLRVKHIRTLMTNYNFPFKINGMKFMCLDKSNPAYTWKRVHDIRVRFQIKVDQAILGDDKNVMFMLLNCKKPTYISTEQKYVEYDGDTVDAMYHESKWIILNRTDNSITNLSTYRQTMAFIKDAVMLDTICKELNV